MKKVLVGLVLALALLCSCIQQTDRVIPSENGSIETLFCQTDSCEQELLYIIGQAEEVRCAFYDLDLDDLIGLLKEKGAEVLVYESNYDGYGKKIVSDGLMHNKFCILDQEIVITGSMNPTFNGAYRNDNNLAIISSRYLAENYLTEFEEIKAGKKGSKTRYPKILFNNHALENYFCPDDECKEKIIEHLSSAEKSIHFMAFSFTDRDIADILIEKSRVIEVMGVMEEKRINMQYNVYHYLYENGVDVVPDGNKYTMHHKVFIIDGEEVIFGSYNPTKAADERNDENIMIYGDKATASTFEREFNRILKQTAVTT